MSSTLSKYVEYSVTVAAGVGMILYGFDQGVFGGLLNGGPFQARFPELTTNSTLQGFTVAVYDIGCAAGALLVMFYGSKMSRRMFIIVGMLVLAVGAVLQFMAYGLVQMIIGRVVTGIGNGLASATLPVWNGEVSSAHSRGRALCYELSLNIFGIMTAYWVDYATNVASGTRDNEYSWRLPLAFQILFAAVTVFCVCFTPESPRYLVSVGKMEEARDVLDMLERDSDREKRGLNVESKIRQIEEAIIEERAASNAGWFDIFKQGKQRFGQRTLLAIFSFSMLQISGINLITYYAPVIFQTSLGMSRDTSLLVSGFNGIAYFLSTFIPIPLIDRIGRRPLMLFSAVGQAIVMAIIAGMTQDPSSKAKGYVAAVMLFVFNTVFAIGFLAIPFLYPMEIVPLAIRSKAYGLSTAIFWLCTFFVVMISPVLIEKIAWKTYLVWTATNAAFVPIIYFFLPETNSFALEEIDLLFEAEPRWAIGPGSYKRLKKLVTENQGTLAVSGTPTSQREEVKMANA